MGRLPEELLLHILSYLSPVDLIYNIRHVSHRYLHLSDEVASTQHIPNFSIGLNFTLSSGSHHRWYDVRGTITTTFRHISKTHPQYALFEVTDVLPKANQARVTEKWKQLSAQGFGVGQEWRVTFRGNG